MEEKIKRKNPMTLKTYLSQFSKEQLIAQIIELNKKYKEIKERIKKEMQLIYEDG